jgi:hypothetical protein
MIPNRYRGKAFWNACSWIPVDKVPSTNTAVKLQSVSRESPDPRALPYTWNIDIFYKHTNPECVSIPMICMPHLNSSIRMSR